MILEAVVSRWKRLHNVALTSFFNLCNKFRKQEAPPSMDVKNVSFEFMSAEWNTDLKTGQVCNVHPYSESGSNVRSYYEVK